MSKLINNTSYAKIVNIVYLNIHNDMRVSEFKKIMRTLKFKRISMVKLYINNKVNKRTYIFGEDFCEECFRIKLEISGGCGNITIKYAKNGRAINKADFTVDFIN